MHLHLREETWHLSKAECGAPDDSYIVIQQVHNKDQCVADADYKFWSTTADGHEYAVCMDYHWIRDTCLSITKRDSHRVSCNDASQPGREKPVRLVTDTTSLDRCPDGGFAHPVRKFSVCTETQSHRFSRGMAGALNILRLHFQRRRALAGRTRRTRAHQGAPPGLSFFSSYTRNSSFDNVLR